MRIKELDSLRGIAAMGVVVFHFSTRFNQLFGHSKYFWLDFPWGAFGVQLFFIISGFVILMTMEKVGSVKEFLIHRFARLFPSYWVAVITTFVLVKIFILPGLEVGRLSALINLTILHSFFNVPSVDGVYWSLEVELIFYAMMVILMVMKKVEMIEKLSFLWVGATLIGGRLNSLTPFPLFLRYASLFLAGMIFYRMKTRGNNFFRNLIIISCLVAQFIIAPLGEAVTVTIFFAIFYLLVNGKLAFLNARWLLFLGAISYPLYLIHENIGYIIIRQLYQWNFNLILVFVAPVAAAVLLATLVHIFVEMPAQKMIRGWWK